MLGLYFNDPSFGLVQSFTMRAKINRPETLELKDSCLKCRKRKVACALVFNAVAV